MASDNRSSDLVRLTAHIYKSGNGRKLVAVIRRAVPRNIVGFTKATITLDNPNRNIEWQPDEQLS